MAGIAGNGDNLRDTSDLDADPNSGRPSRTALAFSPDGEPLVFAGQRGDLRHLFHRPIGSAEVIPIVGTEGAESPVFSRCHACHEWRPDRGAVAVAEEIAYCAASVAGYWQCRVLTGFGTHIHAGRHLARDSPPDARASTVAHDLCWRVRERRVSALTQGSAHVRGSKNPPLYFRVVFGVTPDACYPARMSSHGSLCPTSCPTLPRA